MATSRFNFVSRARYTSPIPPLPNSAVISYDPSCVPIVTDKYNSLCLALLRGLYTSMNMRSMQSG